MFITDFYRDKFVQVVYQLCAKSPKRLCGNCTLRLYADLSLDDVDKICDIILD